MTCISCPYLFYDEDKGAFICLYCESDAQIVNPSEECYHAKEEEGNNSDPADA